MSRKPFEFDAESRGRDSTVKTAERVARLLQKLALAQAAGDRDQGIPAISAVNVPVLGPDGRPIAAFSVAGITERTVREREPEWVALLRTEATHLSSVFRVDAAVPPRLGTRS